MGLDFPEFVQLMGELYDREGFTKAGSGCLVRRTSVAVGVAICNEEGRKTLQ